MDYKTFVLWIISVIFKTFVLWISVIIKTFVHSM